MAASAMPWACISSGRHSRAATNAARSRRGQRMGGGGGHGGGFASGGRRAARAPPARTRDRPGRAFQSVGGVLARRPAALGQMPAGEGQRRILQVARERVVPAV